MKYWISILALIATTAAADPLSTPARDSERSADAEVTITAKEDAREFTPFDVKDVSRALNEKLELELEDQATAAPATAGPMFVSID